MTMLANPERLAHEAIAAAFRPAPPIDYLEWAEQHVVFDEPFPGPYNRHCFRTSTKSCGPCRRLIRADS